MCSKLAALVAAIAICSSSTTASAEFLRRILITADAFVPDEAYSELGDTVRWVNQSGAVQTVTTGWSCEADGTLDLGDIAAGDSASYVVAIGGSGELFGYFSRHTCPGLEGILIVGPDLPVLQASWGFVRSLYR